MPESENKQEERQNGLEVGINSNVIKSRKKPSRKLAILNAFPPISSGAIVTAYSKWII